MKGMAMYTPDCYLINLALFPGLWLQLAASSLVCGSYRNVLLLYTSTQHAGTSLHVASFARPPHISTASDKHRGEKAGYEAGLALPKRVDWV